MPMCETLLMFQAAGLPMSIIIVGVGNADFEGEFEQQLEYMCSG